MTLLPSSDRDRRADNREPSTGRLPSGRAGGRPASAAGCPPRRRTSRRTRLRDRPVRRPGADRLRRVRAGADRPRRPTTACTSGTASRPLDELRRLGQLPARVRPTRCSSGAIGHNVFIVVGVAPGPAPDRPRRCPVAQPQVRGRSFFRMLIFVPYVLSEVIAGVAWLLILQPDGPMDALLTNLGLGSFDPAVAGRPRYRAVDDVGRDHLEVRRVRDHPVPRRAAGHSRGADRGRRRSTGPVGGRSSATSPSRCSARPSGSGRSCRSSAPCSCSTWSGS